MKALRMERIWPRLERRAMLGLWRLIAARSTDRTEALSTGSCLILAPHPDDETLGCGGLAIHKRAAGASVDVIVVTDGGATHEADEAQTLAPCDVIDLREAETIAACARLDIPAENVAFLRYPDGALAGHEADLRERLAGAIAEIDPSEIYVCALQDGHRDHRALARALRALQAEGRLGAAALWEYPVWFWDFRSWRPEGASNKGGFLIGVAAAWRAARSLRTVHVDIAGLEDRKRMALEEHRSQLGLLEGEPGWVGLPQHFLDFFLRDREVFFEIPPPDATPRKPAE